MEIIKKNDAENMRKTLKNALLADDGESLYSKYMKSEISRSEYEKCVIEKNKKRKLNENEIKEKDDLIKKYVNEKMSIQKISNIYNYDWSTIKRKLKEYDILIRPQGSFLVDENGKLLNSKYLKGEISPIKYFNEWSKNKGHKNYSEYQKYAIEEKRIKGESPENCMWSRDEIEDLYAYDKQNLSPRQIGKMHDPPVHPVTIGRWLDEFGIERKTLFEIHGGKNNGNWQGGISFEPYCEKFNENVREYERERWYRRCVLCNKTEDYNSQRMSIHHVDYNKNQGCDSIEWKLIPLCISCNTKVNKNRDYYEKYFTNIINVRETLEEFNYKIDWKSLGI